MLLAPLLAGAIAFTFSSRQQSLYSATVVLRINPPAGSSADFSALQLTQNLTETYRMTVVMLPILDQVVHQLDLPYDWEKLAKKTTATAIRDTQLVRLSVSDTSPDQAALVANTIAQTFIVNVNAETTTQFTAIQDGLQEQMNALQADLNIVEAEIAERDTPENANDASVQGELEAFRLQRSQLQQQLTNLQIQSQSMGTSLATSQTQVTVSEPATPPDDPYAPRIILITLLAVLAGLLVGSVAVAVLELLDNTVRETSDVTSLTGAPLLSSVSAIPKLRPGGDQLYVVSNPRSTEAEAIRLLRANLEFAAAAQLFTTLALTSAGPGEGKSTVTANLAVVMAQSGLVTVIIDADLRKPTQHRIFGVANDRGLTTLLTHPDQRWQDVGADVAVPGLTLLPSGPIPPNPADLLGLDRMANILSRISEEVDIILIDTPPVLAVSDPLVIGAQSDAMILIARAGHTRRDRLQKAASSLHQAGVRLIGVVINQQAVNEGEGYYSFRDYGMPTQSYADSLPPAPLPRQ
ncbi:MAG: polysaccharide biosynthesis tyrosine autokinase [Chloroflexota bacterium]|nr:polysaccharide biosynthesis tyrosine autokinase [Chloroflexota bacterium]